MLIILFCDFFSFHLSLFDLSTSLCTYDFLRQGFLKYPHNLTLKGIPTDNLIFLFTSWQWHWWCHCQLLGGPVCLNSNGDALQPTSQGQGLCCKTITASQAILPLSRLQRNRATIKADPHKGELGSFLLMSGIFRSCSKNPANQWEIKRVIS